MVAGPYTSFRREHDGVGSDCTAGASRAASLAADLDELFEVTAQCLAEYQRLFGVGYPFGKLDQVFVPEFGVLSLDHPGCGCCASSTCSRPASPTASGRPARW